MEIYRPKFILVLLFSVEPPERFVDEFKAPFFRSKRQINENLLPFTFKDDAENELTTFSPCVAFMSLERMKRNYISSHNKTFNSLVASLFRDPSNINQFKLRGVTARMDAPWIHLDHLIFNKVAGMFTHIACRRWFLSFLSPSLAVLCHILANLLMRHGNWKTFSPIFSFSLA